MWLTNLVRTLFNPVQALPGLVGRAGGIKLPLGLAAAASVAVGLASVMIGMRIFPGESLVMNLAVALLLPLVILGVSWYLCAAAIRWLLGAHGEAAAFAGQLTAVCLVPLALRQLVRLGAVFSTQAYLPAPSFSGYITAVSPAGQFLAEVLKRVDLYFAWQILLLWTGICILDQSGSKRLLALFLGGAILLLTGAMAGWLVARFQPALAVYLLLP
jgi:hypothetical protein